MASESDTEDGWGLLENAACSDEEQQQTPDLQWQISGANGLQSQIRLHKGSIDALTESVSGLQADIERVNEETCQELIYLECQFEDLEREMNDRLDREKNATGASQDDVERLERGIHQNILDVMDYRFQDEAGLREALETDVERLERENTSRMDRLEHQNRTLQDGLDQTQKIVEQLHKSIEDVLARMDTDFSVLEQSVKMLESSIRNGDSEYAITQENRLRNLEARVDWLQSNSYANPNNQYLYAPYKTAYIVPSNGNDSVRR